MNIERIMNMDERELYSEFTKLRPIRKQRKWLKNLYEWGDPRHFEAIAAKIESKAEGLTEDYINTFNGFTVTNVKAFIKVLCEYIRGHATLYEVMQEYRYEPTDYSKVESIASKPLPSKLATYFRLCEEAGRRFVGMQRDGDNGERYERWDNAYNYKLEQIDEVEQGIRGNAGYFEAVILNAMYMNDSNDNSRVVAAALDAAKKIVIELNKE